MRLHMCQVYVCTAQDMVLCVGQASLRVSCCVVLWLGRCGGLTTEGQQRLPTLRGGPRAVAAPATLTDLLGARAERVPDCSSYLSRIPGSATDSGSSIHPRDSRGSPSDETLLSHRTGRHHALLNASAASESTTAGGLEACLSQTPALLASRPPLVVLRPSLKASLTPRGLKTRTPNSAGVLCPLLPLV